MPVLRRLAHSALILLLPVLLGACASLQISPPAGDGATPAHASNAAAVRLQKHCERLLAVGRGNAAVPLCESAHRLDPRLGLAAVPARRDSDSPLAPQPEVTAADATTSLPAPTPAQTQPKIDGAPPKPVHSELAAAPPLPLVVPKDIADLEILRDQTYRSASLTGLDVSGSQKIRVAAPLTGDLTLDAAWLDSPPLQTAAGPPLLTPTVGDSAAEVRPQLPAPPPPAAARPDRETEAEPTTQPRPDTPIGHTPIGNTPRAHENSHGTAWKGDGETAHIDDNAEPTDRTATRRAVIGASNTETAQARAANTRKTEPPRPAMETAVDARRRDQAARLPDASGGRRHGVTDPRPTPPAGQANIDRHTHSAQPPHQPAETFSSFLKTLSHIFDKPKKSEKNTSETKSAERTTGGIAPSRISLGTL